MKPNNDKAKDPGWTIPVQLLGVKSEKYQPEIDANKESLHTHPGSKAVGDQPDNRSEKPPMYVGDKQ